MVSSDPGSKDSKSSLCTIRSWMVDLVSSLTSVSASLHLPDVSKHMGS